MDASRYIAANGNDKIGLSTDQAVRMAIAIALRDMADEIEAGMRGVNTMQTYEQVVANEFPVSILHMVTQMAKVPGKAITEAKRKST